MYSRNAGVCVRFFVCGGSGMVCFVKSVFDFAKEIIEQLYRYLKDSHLYIQKVV